MQLIICSLSPLNFSPLDKFLTIIRLTLFLISGKRIRAGQLSLQRFHVIALEVVKQAEVRIDGEHQRASVDPAALRGGASFSFQWSDRLMMRSLVGAPSSSTAKMTSVRQIYAHM